MAKVDCSELAQSLTDIAMNVASRGGVNNLNQVVKRMETLIPGINRQAVVDAIVEATEGRSRQASDLVKRLNEIKAEARQDKRLQRKINQLQQFIEKGIVPKTQKKAEKGTEAIEALRSIRDDLKKKIAKSGPAQKEKLEKRITDLTKRIESGDILPKPKPVEIPKSKELEKLQFQRDELQRDIRRRINNLKPRSIFGRLLQDPFNVARNIMTAFDFSAVFRQGGFIALGHPVRAIKNLVPMFKAFSSEQRQDKIAKDLKDRPNAPLYAKAGLFLAPTDGSYQLSKQEEIMQSKLIKSAEKVLPGLAGSNRAYITFLNELRADSFDVMATGLSKHGDVTLEEAKIIANYVNIATGRGNLGVFEQAAQGLNVAFFAPRYVASRFQLLGGLFTTPVKAVFGKNKRVHRLIVKEYARYIIGMGMVYALAALTLDDEEFEFDPRSSDFGKIKIGKTRLDPLSGISQVTVLLSRIISGQVKSSITGQINPIRGEDVGFGRRTTAGVIGSFLRYKLSPMFGTTLNLLTGKDPVGQPFGPKDLPKSLLIPLAMREILETMQEQGIPSGPTLSLLAIFGMGIQTYGSQTKKPKFTSVED